MASPRHRPAPVWVIWNPTAGRARAWRGVFPLQSIIEQQLGSIELRATEARGDARRLAREAVERGASEVIVVGGDGTLNEVVNGLLDRGTPCGTCLSVLPAGSGQDFARSLGAAKDPFHVAARLAQTPPRVVDVGRASYTNPAGGCEVRYFVNVADFGIGAAVAGRVDRSPKRLGGKAAFYWATVRTLMGWRNQQVRIAVDGGPWEEWRVKLVALGNGRYFGGGMCIAPEAFLDDGVLQLTVLGDVGTWTSLWKQLDLYRGRRIRHDQAQYRTCRSLVAEGEPGVMIDLDGEQPGGLPARFEVVPRALPVRCHTGAFVT